MAKGIGRRTKCGVKFKMARSKSDHRAASSCASHNVPVIIGDRIPGLVSVALRMVGIAALCAAAATPAAAQEGGLYIAGAGVSFAQAAVQALKADRVGQRFFLLVLPPETRALQTIAAGPIAAVRERVLAAGGVLYVCQRDVDSGKVRLATLVPGVIAVRGWPPAGRAQLPENARDLSGENPATLPASNEALRRLRSTCAS